jgi:hypothetical protein
MTAEKAKVSRVVRDARHDAAPLPRSDDRPRLHFHIATPTAKVMLIPGQFRGAEYVRRHVEYVVAMGAEKGEAHIVRNLGAIERTLREMGVDDAAVAAELRTIEGRVRAELWWQILTPEGGA